ncbi:hypothetical protein [Hymenobacter rubripertinctus]|uniref:DUF2314 domain-containing protein n=1 Tax=Hymenobacter rubripertinctus TaxID=2029981 RepID=A0A418R6N1_9BACT|nr:hypothetical protein [Hymenobacter rubripertinctus]RIY12954.1 hypothetical protein D0T11_04295 [Hymenobacter rubripertinctus]
MRNSWFVLLLVLLPLATRAQAPKGLELAGLVRQVHQAAGQELPAPLLREARRSLGTAKKAFGQAPGSLYLLTRVLNESAIPELVVVAVEAWQGPVLRGRIVRTVAGRTAATAPVEFDEAAVQDWLLLSPDGRETGNRLGRFWDLEERLAERGE